MEQESNNRLKNVMEFRYSTQISGEQIDDLINYVETIG